MRFIFFLLFMPFAVIAQVDRTNKPIKIELVAPLPNETENSTFGPSIEYKSILDKEDNLLKRYSITKKNETSKSILDQTSDFKNPGDEYKDKLNRKKSDKDIDESFKKNQFLGEFKSNAKYIKIVCRDHEYPDGDRVRILINDKVVVSDILLESAAKEYYLDLAVGFNKIEFLALNQGTSGPNTAAFRVYDDKGIMITSNEWNLITGVKATIVVVKENSKDSNSE